MREARSAAVFFFFWLEYPAALNQGALSDFKTGTVHSRGKFRKQLAPIDRSHAKLPSRGGHRYYGSNRGGQLEGKGNNRLVSSRTSFSGPGLKRPRRVPKMRQQTSNVDIHQAEPLD